MEPLAVKMYEAVMEVANEEGISPSESLEALQAVVKVIKSFAQLYNERQDLFAEYNRVCKDPVIAAKLEAVERGELSPTDFAEENVEAALIIGKMLHAQMENAQAAVDAAQN